ncbi:MAG: Abi family protein [Treponema sp.]|nr:Abi family protein [Treponema sp.]
MTYDQQLRKLRDEKGLSIPDEAHALDILAQIGYFSLINGYKAPFKDPGTGQYRSGTAFGDIENLYFFDEALRELFFKFLLKVEQKLKSHISYCFSEKKCTRIFRYGF